MDIANLSITVNKTSINGKMYDVLSYDEYVSTKNNSTDIMDIAVQFENKVDNNMILPYRGPYSGHPMTPGIYDGGCVSFVVEPDPGLMSLYKPKVVSISNLSDIKEIINNSEVIRKMDEPFLTPDSEVTAIPIKETDQPEMKALKMAINAKHIDLDKYAARFGINYNNDKRQLKNSSATLNIIKRYCDNCDMEAILTIRDKSSDVPNPMKTEITISLTDDSYQNNEE